MNTRIIHTEIYTDDDWFNSLSPTNGEKFFFIYLFTNRHIDKTGIYELSERVMHIETGLSLQRIEKFKAKFSATNKVIFYKDWVYVVNAKKRNDYSGPLNEKSFKKEIDSIPLDILSVFNDRVTIPYQAVYIPREIINKKDKIINKKEKEINNKSENPGLEKVRETVEKFKKTTPKV